jgi:hypothetical protein
MVHSALLVEKWTPLGEKNNIWKYEPRWLFGGVYTFMPHRSMLAGWDLTMIRTLKAEFPKIY